VEPRILSPDQFLLTTLVFKLAVMALLATMLVRFRRFRHILIFERRDFQDRLILSLSLGVPLTFGIASRILLHYYAADLTLEGAFLAGVRQGMQGFDVVVDALHAIQNGEEFQSEGPVVIDAAGYDPAGNHVIAKPPNSAVK